MGLLLGRITTSFEIFFLIFVRMTGLFLMSPVFGRKNVPLYLKIGLALLLSYIVFSGQFMLAEIEIENFAHLAYFVIKEMLVGLTMGFITTLVFSAVWTAGQIVDTQIGFGIVNVLDPHSNLQVPLMGNFKNILALLVFFTVNGHHKLVQIIFKSYDAVPLGRGIITEGLSMGMVRLFADSFILSMKIALPVVAASFLSEVAFGILVRAVPQMNIFIIGIPFKIFIGLVAMLMFIPIYISILNGVFNEMFSNISSMLWEMTPK